MSKGSASTQCTAPGNVFRFCASVGSTGKSFKRLLDHCSGHVKHEEGTRTRASPTISFSLAGFSFALDFGFLHVPSDRAIRETHMNQASSRSHSIFQIVVEQKRRRDQDGERILRSKFNLVDLAG